MIDNATESRRLYYFDFGDEYLRPSKWISSSFESFFALNNDDIKNFNSSFPILQNSETSMAPITNSHDSPTEPTPVISEELGEYGPTFSHENTNENIKDGDNERIEMSHNDETLVDNTFEAENKIWKGRSLWEKSQIEWWVSHPNTTMNLSWDESLKKKKDKSISMFDSRIIYPDIDEPIAIRKSIRSCTKYPLFNFISY